MKEYHTFGEAAMQARFAAGLTLRGAARALELSPSYLSKIELNKAEAPSADVIKQMARAYGVPLTDLLRYAHQRVRDVIGNDVHENPGLFALYRLANDMKSEEILSLIGKLLSQLPPEEKIRLEQKMRSQFPRLAYGQSLLYAAKVRPRYLSKLDLRRIAEKVLASYGLTPETYEPPTPIENIIEKTDGVFLHPSDSIEMGCQRDGSPLVLGLTRWDLEGRRLIEINEKLYDTEEARLRRRLNYTLAHEYWHAIEHLPLMNAQSRHDGGLFRINTDERVMSTGLKWWEKKTKRRLETHEDWQEWQAQYFAGELLMPHWSVHREFRKRFSATALSVPSGVSRGEFADEVGGAMFEINGRFLTALNELYDVSRQAMAIRLMDLGLVV